MNVEKRANKDRLIPHGKHGGEIYGSEINPSQDEILDFSTNINEQIPPELIKNAMIKATSQILQYPDSDSSDLRQELLHYFGSGLTPKHFIVGAGSMELITIFCDMFVSPGDEVIIPHPTFSEYEWAVQRNGGKINVLFRKESRDFRIDSEWIIKSFKSNTKVIFLCNPNNPNGLLDSASEIERIITAALKREIMVLLDETFIEFTGEQNSFASRIHNFENVFICRTFTKFYGVPGLRVGFGIGSPKMIDILRKGQNLWSVNCIGQAVAQELLRNSDSIKKTIPIFEQERNYLADRLRTIPQLKVYPSSTNYLLLNLESLGITARELKDLLLKEGILIRDCSNYPGLNEFHVRIAIKSREKNSRLLDLLQEIVKKR